MKMKKMILAAVSVMAAMLCLASCGSGESLPFEKVDNYYFKNGASLPETPVINSPRELLSHFGMAATMSPDGKPTFVDFEKNFVIAVVPPRTDKATELIPVSVTRRGETLVFTYKEQVGEQLSYIMQPLLLISVDRQYQSPKGVVKKK